MTSTLLQVSLGRIRQVHMSVGMSFLLSLYPAQPLKALCSHSATHTHTRACVRSRTPKKGHRLYLPLCADADHIGDMR